MGFFSSVGRGLLGAAGGFLMGGPIGAVAGGLSGALSGDPASRTTTNSGSQASTQQTQLRGLDAAEQGLQDQSYAGVNASMQQLSPEERARQLQQNRDYLYNASSERINTAYDDASARQYSNAASRGAANTSTGNARQDRQTAYRGRELGLASDRAGLESQNMLLQQQADRRANAAAYMQNLNAVWNRQLQGSKITTTGSGANTTVAPDRLIPEAMGAIGYGLTNPDSYYSQNGLLGGGGGGGGSTPASAYSTPASPLAWNFG